MTVCIPTYNHASSVAKAVKSVLDQTWSDFEILVVDDCSTDGTLDQLREFTDDRLRIVSNDRNLGLVGNHNRCLDLAEGRMIQFVHGDDWLRPDALGALAPAFDDGQVSLAFAPRSVVTEDSAWLADFASLHDRFSALEEINIGNALLDEYVRIGRVKGNWFGEPTSVMFRADVGRAVGGFDPRLVQMLDMEFWSRVAAGHRVAWVARPLSFRSHTDGTASARNSTSAVAYVDRLMVLRSLLFNRRLEATTRRRVSVLMLVAAGRTFLDACGRSVLAADIRAQLRVTMAGYRRSAPRSAR